MSGLDLNLILLAGLVFLAAGTIKGTVGIGLPTAAVGMLSQFIDPRLAIALVTFPLLSTNLWQMLRAGQFIQTFQRYRLFILFLMSVLGATTFALPYVPTAGLVLALGVVVIVFAVTNLAFTPPPIPDHLDKPAQILGGIVAGIIGGLTSIWGPPMVIYLVGRRTEKDEFVRALGVMLFLGGIPMAIGFWINGLLTGPSAGLSAALIIPSIAGFALGEQLRKLLPPEKFRTAVLIMFLLMGLNLVRRAVM